MTDLALSDEWRDEITEMLNRFPEVRWDRFALAPVPSDDEVQHAVLSVFGWVDRPDKSDRGRADFITLQFATWDSVGLMTSSARYSREFHARVYGNDAAADHHDCIRVEDAFPGVLGAIHAS